MAQFIRNKRTKKYEIICEPSEIATDGTVLVYIAKHKRIQTTGHSKVFVAKFGAYKGKSIVFAYPERADSAPWDAGLTPAEVSLPVHPDPAKEADSPPPPGWKGQPTPIEQPTEAGEGPPLPQPPPPEGDSWPIPEPPVRASEEPTEDRPPTEEPEAKATEAAQEPEEAPEAPKVQEDAREPEEAATALPEALQGPQAIKLTGPDHLGRPRCPDCGDAIRKGERCFETGRLHK